MNWMVNDDKFVGLRAKSYLVNSFLIDDASKNKKSKRHKKVCHKKTLKHENYKNCSEATQLGNKINHLKKNQIDIDSFRKRS